MKVKPGQTWKLRGGGQTTIKAVKEGEPFPIKATEVKTKVGLYQYPETQPASWMPNGRFWDESQEHRFDLIEEL